MLKMNDNDIKTWQERIREGYGYDLTFDEVRTILQMGNEECEKQSQLGQAYLAFTTADAEYKEDPHNALNKREAQETFGRLRLLVSSKQARRSVATPPPAPQPPSAANDHSEPERVVAEAPEVRVVLEQHIDAASQPQSPPPPEHVEHRETPRGLNMMTAIFIVAALISGFVLGSFYEKRKIEDSLAQAYEEGQKYVYDVVLPQAGIKIQRPGSVAVDEQ